MSKLLYVIVCVLLAAGCVYALRKKGAPKLYRAGMVLCALLLTAAAAFFGWAGVYYHADNDALAALSSRDTVTVERLDRCWRFDGPGQDTALIFYPGGKVEPAAYAPLLTRLAEGGVDAFLPEMPLRLAILDRNAADRIIGKYDYKNWVLAGHSLGGVAASGYAGAHPERVKGLLLLAAYPAGELSGELPMLCIYGDRDGVLNRENYEKSRSYWPQGAQELVIPGGNHAGFGSYGAQKGDGEAALTAREQQERTAAAVLDWLRQRDAGAEPFYRSAEGYACGWWLRDLLENVSPLLKGCTLTWK